MYLIGTDELAMESFQTHRLVRKQYIGTGGRPWFKELRSNQASERRRN